MVFMQLGGRSRVLVSLKPRLDSSVSGRVISGSFKLVRSETVSETLSGVPSDVCWKYR